MTDSADFTRQAAELVAQNDRVPTQRVGGEWEDGQMSESIEEGDGVFLRVRVYRCNGEQALVEFASMQGPYSIRVPLAELTRSGLLESDA